MHASRPLRAVILLMFGPPLAAGCKPSNEFKPPPPMKVEVAQPVKRPVQRYLVFTGTTRALRRVEIRARISGYLEEIAFQDGAAVKEGDLLFRIDPAPYQAKLDIATAQLRQAEANLQIRSVELGRTRGLAQRGASSKQELDIATAESAGSEAAVAAARAAVREAELQLSYTEVRAPITGRIGEHKVDVGNLVTPEQTLLAVIESTNPIYADFTMSESDLLALTETAPGERPVPLEQRDLDLHMGLGDQADFPFEGKLDFRDLGIDPSTGTITYRARFENPDGRILSGLFARLRISVGQPELRLLVPEPAIGTDQRGDYVLVLRDDQTTDHRMIRTGVAQDGLRVVDDGLKPEEWIIINGVQRARPNAKVNPERVELPARPGDPVKPLDPPPAGPKPEPSPDGAPDPARTKA
jgi:RND family efflux transporter MFP subunit